MGGQRVCLRENSGFYQSQKAQGDMFLCLDIFLGCEHMPVKSGYSNITCVCKYGRDKHNCP